MRIRPQLAVLLLATVLGLPTLAEHGKRQPVTRALEGWALAPFTLTDHHGRSFTHAQLRGRWTFVLFGDTTACPGQLCGAALTSLAGVCQRIARTEVMKTTQVLFISLDPQHDTPARLREFVAKFGNCFVGATAAPHVLQGVLDDMGVSGVVPVTSPGAARPYGGSVLLIGPDVSIRAEYLPPLDAPRMTASYLRTRISRR